jgi:hypothetical protein
MAENNRYLLLSAKQEIVSLRQRNEILDAQVGVMQVFAAALGLKRNEGGMAPDVAWELQKAIDEIDRDTLRAEKPDDGSA